MFAQPLENTLRDFKNMSNVDWLNNASKSLEDFKNASTFDDDKIAIALEVMQMYAHGIEVIIKDQKALENKQYEKPLRDIAGYLKEALCVTQSTLNELSIPIRSFQSPITSIAGNRNSTERKLEDWVIYTYYIEVMTDIVSEIEKMYNSNS